MPDSKAAVVSEVTDTGYPLRDADDLPYLNLAVAANAGYLVRWDKDLRVLMQEASFTARFPDLHVVNPVKFLQAVRATQRP